MRHDIRVMSTDFWVDAWNAHLEGTPGRVRSGYATPGFWDTASKDYNAGNDDESRRRTAAMLERFREDGVLFDGAEVLDIGCGTGTFAMALAESGARVTALDFSSGMLERFRESIPPHLAGVITLVTSDWSGEDLDERGWRKRFDLVCAHMTPAVNTPEALFKLMDASRGGCSLKGWGRKRENPVLARLWETIMEQPMSDRPPDIIFQFNLLYSMGLFPRVEFEDVRWEKETPVQDLTAYYVSYFSGVCDLTASELEGRIASTLGELFPDGTAREITTARKGHLYWLMDRSRMVEKI